MLLLKTKSQTATDGRSQTLVIILVLLGRVRLVPEGFPLSSTALPYFVFFFLFFASAKRCHHLGNKAIWVGERRTQMAPGIVPVTEM